jgi:PAS domain S-box-containing protein
MPQGKVRHTSNPSLDFRRRKIVLGGFVSLLFAAMAIFALTHFNKIMNDTKAFLDSVATQKVRQIRQFRKSYLTEAKTFSTMEDIVEDFRRLVDHKDLEARKDLIATFSNFNENYPYSATLALGPDSSLLISTHDSVAYDASLERFLRYAAVTRSPMMSPLHFLPPFGIPGLNIIVPIFADRSDQARLLGYVVHFLEAKDELFPIISEWPSPSETAESLLLRKNNGRVEVLGNLKAFPNAALSTSWSLDDQSTVETLAVQNQSGLIVAKNYLGRWTLGLAKPVEGTDWILVSTISRKEVFAPWIIIFVFAGLVFIAGSLTFVLAGYVAIHVRSTRHYKNLLETEKNLRTAERKFLAFMDRMPSYVIIKNEKGIVLFANKALQDRDKGKEWIGKSTEELFDPELAKSIRFWDKAALEKGYVEYEETWLNRSGEKIHFSTQKFKISLDGGVSLIGEIMTDITEKGRTMRQLREMNDNLEDRVGERTAQLERINLELQTFVNTLSHDLRSPLRSMEGFAELLEEQYAEALDDSGRHYLARIRKAGHRMTELINDLVALSKISNVELRRETVDLGHMANAIISEYIKKEPDRVVSISIKTSMSCEGDSILLEALLRNLIDNAFKFSTGRAKTVIEIGATKRHPQYPGPTFYYIKDNGIGFDMAYAQSLFQPFHRVHGVDEYSGNGIGLSIAKRIVDRHGGRIWLESEPGEGTTAFFSVKPE